MKKLISLALSLLLMLPLASGVVAAEDSISYTLSDASSLMKYIAGWGKGYYRSGYDYNGDVRINMYDVSCILKDIAGWNKDDICLARPSEELILQINDDIVKYMVDNYGYPSDTRIIGINTYYGTYSEAVVFMYSYLDGDMSWSEYIDGIEISYSSTDRISVWKDGSFYNMHGAYDNGILTKEDVEKIAYIQNNRLGIDLLYKLP